jgi:predicted CoA-substrate-specific enzyme activase
LGSIAGKTGDAARLLLLEEHNMLRVGLDIGSTTIKCVVLDENDKILYSTYERHYSHVLEKGEEILSRLAETMVPDGKALLAISGSAGMGLADGCKVPFVQEVFATRVAAKRLMPETDCVIELGGEDAKILFLTNGTEVRMNGSCAGGTGAFIDQMATLLKMSADEMDKAAQTATRTYTIASRCGVFAKSDIQPLINQGAQAGDIAASIYQAVVNQTIAGLAQGRPIGGNVLYLGGPLTFSSVLRKSFDETLHVHGTCPENSLLFVAMGAAWYADQVFSLAEVAQRLKKYSSVATYASQPPLFANQQEYETFHARHQKASVPCLPFGVNAGPVHIGIDAGSTTVKLVVIDNDRNILYENYQPNLGNPIPLIREVLIDVYTRHPNLHVASVTTTGYGEELVRNAFSCDYGLVETVAHFTAAKYFMPDVDFIIDIGGQDMKCFKIEDGAISNIFLNEACSSGCGSFLQTFAQALGYDVKEFAALGLFADRPVDLGSRCTVFMNSSVKQAQKDGATIENISAGLSISVVKNALYKVIRCSSPQELGKKIVVQGGTFYNEAVLRAFEKEMGVEVIRPDIAGLMGAYGAALYGREKAGADARSSVLDLKQLQNFEHKVTSVQCKGCGNHCQLTINVFAGGKRFISGNRCDKPVTGKTTDDSMDLYAYKLELLLGYQPGPGPRGSIGIPLCLNMYELLPFWHTFFTKLGFSVHVSPTSSRALYQEGQATIPSDTACFPAKLAHGHIAELSKMGCDAIFYPCMTYNVDEGLGDNHYNCPVVAYYPEVLAGNCPELAHIVFIYDYVDLARRKDFEKKMPKILGQYFTGITPAEIRAASDAAYAEYEHHMTQLREKGAQIIAKAREEHRRIIVLAGRPYHVDPEVNHGIDKLILRQGAAVVSEDSVSWHESKFATSVLNQWTYHSRLYAAAKYCTTQPDMDLVQLVSFGCGVDAITTDETREILQTGGKLYTQLKIDEITNLGAVNIRLRSLFAALDEKAAERKRSAEHGV